LRTAWVIQEHPASKKKKPKNKKECYSVPLAVSLEALAR
jgi:hypothetical protein